MKGGAVGRPNKPAAIKSALGNPGGRALNLGAMKVPIQIPEKPKRIVGEAAIEWDRLAEVLQDNSLITLLDRTALIIYVDAFSIYDAAIRQLKRDGYLKGMMQTTAKTDYQTLSGVALVLRDARSTMLSIMTQFGMTPSARERVSVHNNQESIPFPDRDQLN